MSSLAQLSDALSGASSNSVLGRRLIDSAAPYEFRLKMRNDFLTPQGTAYKWQEVRARVARTVLDAVQPPLVPVRYTWETVESQTGTPETATNSREWTFARGQGFTSALLHSDAHGTPPVSDHPVPTTTEISYPDLPKAPAVDLLLMLSWDVLMFETICTELAITPALSQTGVSVDLERLSGAWADLRFSNPRTSTVFRNSQMTAIKQGYGLYSGRPVATYTYQCLDCDMTARLGPLVQQGTSTYWGTLQIDLRTGDLAGADFIEMIVATVTRPDGRRMPVQKRRVVRISATDPNPPVPVEVAIELPVSADPVLLDEAEQGAGRLVSYLRAHISSFGGLPVGFEPLTNVGFRSIVGVDLHAILGRVRALRGGLRAWAAGDPDAAVSTRATLPTMRGELEGFLAYCQIAADVAGQLNFLNGHALEKMQREMAAIRHDVAQLGSVLGRLEDDVDAR